MAGRRPDLRRVQGLQQELNQAISDLTQHGGVPEEQKRVPPGGTHKNEEKEEVKDEYTQ